MIGDPNYDPGHYHLGGAVFVYYGGFSGLSSSPDWEYRGDEALARLGWSVSAAGDLDGDGYDDLIVGAPGYPIDGDERGRVFVFHGSSAGLPATPMRVIDGEASTPLADRMGLGWLVSGAGDVSGDGFDDVVLGDPRWGDTHSEEGVVYVYLGSVSGLAATPVWSFEGNESTTLWGGIAAGAGDVDQDGFDDILVGRGYRSSDLGQQLDLYRGGGVGPWPVPSWTARDGSGELVGSVAAGAGDVNGDGSADIVVGDQYYGDYGAVFVYFGENCVDLDGDEFCEEHDCDDTNPNCTSDCRDFDADSICFNLDCDDFRPECGANCADADHDFVCGEADCDDLEPACAADCVADVDSDGTPDCSDNCPEAHNPDQLDSDGDGVGNVCDCPFVDDDYDGVCDSVDNCPATTNHDQADLDEDGLGDVCDPCPVTPASERTATVTGSATKWISVPPTRSTGWTLP